MLQIQIIKLYFAKSITDEDFIQITIPPGAYEIERSNIELKRIKINEEHFTEANYHFTIKPHFSTLGSILEISPHGPVTVFQSDNSIRDVWGFKPNKIYEEYKLSDYPVDIISFDRIFFECDIA